VNSNHGVLAVWNVERSHSRPINSYYWSAAAPQVTTVALRIRTIVVTSDDVTVVSSRKTGLKSLSYTEVLVVYDDEAFVSSSKRYGVTAVFPPVDHWLTQGDVVKLDHIEYLAPTVLANPLAIETLDVFCGPAAV
jgi:hypothetical protein